MIGTRLKSSLVSQARQLTGRAVRELRLPENGGADPGPRTLSGPAGDVVPMPPDPVRPAADGYVRRSPVQPLYRSADYYRRRAMRAAGAVLLLALICAGVYLLLRLKLIRL